MAAGPRAGACRLRRFGGRGDGALGNVGNAKFEGGLRFWVCFAVRALRSLGLGGLGRAAPGDERVGLAVLSPPRVILSQARISRGKGGWGVLASAALPRWGKGRCRCAYSTLFAPAGQKRFRVGAPDFGRFTGKSFLRGRFAHQETFPARQGNGVAGHISSPLLFAANIRSEAYGRDRFFPLYHLFAPAKGHLPALPAAPPSPDHPAGRPAGSARTRSRVQTLENPFLGTATVSPAAPVSQPPQADGPCSWAVCRVCALPLEQKRNEASMPPARGAWMREHGANGTGRRHCRPAPAQGIHPLRIPFWGWQPFPRSPRPPTAAGGKPLLVGLPPSTPTIAPPELNRSTPAPCSWGGRASNPSQRHWPAALPPLDFWGVLL